MGRDWIVLYDRLWARLWPEVESLLLRTCEQTSISFHQSAPTLVSLHDLNGQPFRCHAKLLPLLLNVGRRYAHALRESAHRGCANGYVLLLRPRHANGHHHDRADEIGTILRC